MYCLASQASPMYRFCINSSHWRVVESTILQPPDFFKDVSYHVSFRVKFDNMRCCAFSINNPYNSCVVTWLLTWKITFWVKYSIKKLGEPLHIQGVVVRVRIDSENSVFWGWEGINTIFEISANHGNDCSIDSSPVGSLHSRNSTRRLVAWVSHVYFKFKYPWDGTNLVLDQKVQVTGILLQLLYLIYLIFIIWNQCLETLNFYLLI